MESTSAVNTSPIRKFAPVAWFLIFIPPAVVLYFIYLYGVDVPWLDDWDVLPDLSQQVMTGHLTLAALWQQHNEHRIVIPRIAMALLGFWSRYNTIVFMYFTAVCLMVAAGAIFFALRQSHNKTSVLFFLPLSVLIFSLRQFENLLWGFQIGFALAACLPVLAFLFLFILNGAWRWKFAAAVVVALLATYSSAQGLLVWPAGLVPLVFAQSDRRMRYRLVAAWIVIGAIAWRVYFIGYVRPVEHPQLSISSGYFLSMIGGSLFPRNPAAITASIFILVAALIALVQLFLKSRLSSTSFWLGLLVFSFLVEGVTMAGRSGFGTGQALASRYSTFSILTVVGVYGLLSFLLSESRNAFNVGVFAILTGVIMVSAAEAAHDGFYTGKIWRSVKEASALAFASCESPPMEVIPLHPDLAVMHRQSAVMRKLRVSNFGKDGLVKKYDLLFDGVTTRPTPAELKVDGFSFFPEYDSLIVVGWAIDSLNNTVAGGVQLRIGDKAYPAYYGLSRRDVVFQSKNPRLEFSGFRACIPLHLVGPGTHEVAFSVLSYDRQTLFKPQNVTLQLP